MKYFQTWMYVSRINRIAGGKYVVKTIQFICGLRGHELSKTEWGYGGGEFADCWCRWCNKFIQVPKSVVQFTHKDATQLMKQVGTEYSDT
jgi:hypothetical protein